MHEETATLLDRIAAQIASGEQSLDLAEATQKAQDALNRLRHVEGVALLSRISLLLGVANRQTSSPLSAQKAVGLLLGAMRPDLGGQCDSMVMW
jgi:hypothetical protein